MDLNLEEILANALSLVGLAVFVISMIVWSRFIKRAKANCYVDFQDQRQTAWKIFWGVFACGACIVIAGLSLSLASPKGMERPILGEVISNLLICSGGLSLIMTSVFLAQCSDLKAKYTKDKDDRIN